MKNLFGLKFIACFFRRDAGHAVCTMGLVFSLSLFCSSSFAQPGSTKKQNPPKNNSSQPKSKSGSKSIAPQKKPSELGEPDDGPVSPSTLLRPNAKKYLPKSSAVKPTRTAKSQAKKSYDSAREADKRGEFNTAIAEFQAAYENDAHPVIGYRLASAMQKAKRFEDALDAIDAVLLNPRIDNRGVTKLLQLEKLCLEGADDLEAFDKRASWRGDQDEAASEDGDYGYADSDTIKKIREEARLAKENRADAVPDEVNPAGQSVYSVPPPIKVQVPGKLEPGKGEYVVPPKVVVGPKRVPAKADAPYEVVDEAVVEDEPPPAVRSNVEKAQQLMDESGSAAERNDWLSAASLAKKAYLSNPNPKFAFKAGRYFEKAARWQDAVDQYTEALANETASASEQCLIERQLQKAQATLKQKLANAPDLALRDVDGVYTDGAKLWLDQTGYQPRIGAVTRAAVCMEFSGDQERAAVLYRKLIEVATENKKDSLDPALNKPTVARSLVDLAEKKLDAMNLDVRPKFRATRVPVTKYLIDKEGPDGPLYLEETTPAESPYKMLQARILNHLRSASPRNAKTNLKAIRSSVKHLVGVEDAAEVDRIILQIAVKELGSDGTISMDTVRQKLIDQGGLKVEGIELSEEMPTPDADRIQQRRVKYLKSSAERAPYQLKPTIAAGKIRLTQGNENLDTTAMSTAFSGKGWGIYVMNPDGKMYVASHEIAQFHHSSFLAGSEVAGAGEIQVVDGEIQSISNKSGHYQPKAVHLAQTLKQLKDDGIDLSSVKVRVLGKTKNADGKIGIEVLDWDSNANQFLSGFTEEAAKKDFVNQWKAKGFLNDPFEGTDDEGKFVQGIQDEE